MQTYSFLVPVRVGEGTATLVPDEMICFTDVDSARRKLMEGYELRRAVLMLDDEVYDESTA